MSDFAEKNKKSVYLVLSQVDYGKGVKAVGTKVELNGELAESLVAAGAVRVWTEEDQVKETALAELAAKKAAEAEAAAKKAAEANDPTKKK